MFNNSGLSLDQAPPISVVLRFFLVGSLFGVAGGIWLLYMGAKATDGYSPAGLVTTHIFTLGVMLSFMLGALFQMLPVLAGVSFKEPVTMAIRTQYPIVAGSITLLFGLYLNSELAYLVAGILLSIGIIPTTFMMLSRLIMLKSHSPSSRGMGFAIYGLIFTISLGLVMLAIRSGWSADYYGGVKSAHIAFGLIGWIALLIISVSFQVIEMFYVTDKFPQKIADYTPLSIAGIATLLFIIAVNSNIPIAILNILLYIITAIYAIYAISRVVGRKRAVSDATIRFWLIGLISLLLFSIVATINEIGLFTQLTLNLMKILFPLFAISIVFGMSYKIVPFLTWFHLNAQGYFKAPMMHEVISPKYATTHLYIHSITAILATLSLIFPTLWHLTGAMIVVSFSWIAVAIYRAWHKYLAVQATGERWDMGSFGVK